VKAARHPDIGSIYKVVYTVSTEKIAPLQQ